MRVIAENTGRTMMFLVLASLLWTSAAYGQNGSSPGRVLYQIEQAEQFLQSAREQLGEDPPQEAENYLNQAEQLLASAREEYENGNTDLAGQLASQAKTMIQRALRVQPRRSRESLEAERQLERCRQLIENLSPKITSLGNPKLSQMLAKAQQIFKKGEKEYDAGNYRLSVSLSKQALSLLHKIAGEISGGADPEKVADMIDYTAEVIQKALEEHAENQTEGFKSLVAAAQQLQRQAQESFDRGDIRAAADLTLSARRKIQQAIKYAGTSPQTSILSKIRETRAAAKKISIPQGAGNEIENLLSDAENFANNGDFARARENLARAQKIIAQYSTSSAEVSRESAARAIEITDQIINSASPRTENGKSLLQQAKVQQERAKADFNAGNYSSALNKTRVAKTLAEQAE
ncbi:hypothetical protein J7K99_07655 [bacterium]|nr:hypothetical protein [bacterium]